jgi:hypothetical protein
MAPNGLLKFKKKNQPLGRTVSQIEHPKTVELF